MIHPRPSIPALLSFLSGALSVAAAADDRVACQPSAQGEPVAWTAGRLEEYTSDGAVVSGKDSGKSVVKADALVAAEFDRPVKPMPAGDGVVRIFFNNGDVVSGKAVSCAGGKITLETAFGRTETSLDFLRELVFSPKGAGGSGDLVEAGKWTAPPNALDEGADENCVIKDGTITIKGRCGAIRSRDAEFAQAFVFKMEIGAHDDLVCGIAVKKTKPGDRSPPAKPGECTGYQLQCSDKRLILGVLAAGQPRKTHTLDLPPVKGAAATRRLALTMDGRAKTMMVAVDDETPVVFKDVAPVSGGWKSILLAGQNNDVTVHRMSLRNLLSDSGKDPAKAAASDALTFVNGDRMPGALVSIADGKVKFTGDVGTLEIPLVRLDDLELSNRHARKHGEKGCARVALDTGECATLRLESIKDGVLTGNSEALGTCRIGMDRVESIEFKKAE